MVSKNGVRSINLRDAEKQLGEINSGGDPQLPPASFVGHIDLSEGDMKELIKQSLNTIVSNQNLRRKLLRQEGVVYIQADGVNEYAAIPNIEPISQEQITAKIRSGEAIDYLQNVYTETTGKLVRVVFNYHMPTVNGNAYVSKGIRLILFYNKIDGRMVLKHIETEHF